MYLYCYNSNFGCHNMPAINIARAVRGMRKKSNLSQQQLAQLAGVGKTVIYDIEKGKTSVQLDTLLKVLDVLNIKLELNLPITLSEDSE